MIEPPAPARPPPEAPVEVAAPAALSRRVRRFVVVWTALLSLLNTLGTAASPYLLVNHPLVLVGLSAESRHLLLAAGRTELLPLLIVGTARRFLSMTSTYGLAAVYGFTVVRWLERKHPRIGAVIRWVERLFGRIGMPLLVFAPTYTVNAVAGAARAPLLPFLGATLLGQALFVWVSVVSGDALSPWTEPVLAFIEEHLLTTTLVVALLVGLQQLLSRRAKPPDLTDGVSADP